MPLRNWDSGTQGRCAGVLDVVCVRTSHILQLRLFISQVGFQADNDRFIHVLEGAGEALTQAVQKVDVPDETPLASNLGVDYWIECYRCGKSRKVPKEYFDRNKASDSWHCGIEGSPVPLPKEGRCEFSCRVVGLEGSHFFETGTLIRAQFTSCGGCNTSTSRQESMHASAGPRFPLLPPHSVLIVNHKPYPCTGELRVWAAY